jgi:hypothetical protein
MDSDPNDGVKKVGEFSSFDGDGERDAEGEFAAVGIGLDFVALLTSRISTGRRGTQGRTGKRGKEGGRTC